MAESTPTYLFTATDMPSWYPRRRRGRVPDPAISTANDPKLLMSRRYGCHAYPQAGCAALICANVLVGSCQALNAPREFEQVDATGSAIRFTHGDFQPDLAEYAIQRNPRTGGEVHLASFHGPDSSAVLVAIKAGPAYVLEERSTESVVPGLMPEDAEIVWGARGGTMSGVGYTSYRLFEVADQPVSCVGFAQSAGQSYDDRNRKPNAIFGYFCRDESRAMTSQSAEEMLAQVKLTRGGRTSTQLRP